MSEPSSEKTGQERMSGLRGIGLSQRRRIPVIRQLTIAECGGACLAMVLGWHGRRTTLREIRRVLGTSIRGVDAISIIRAAREFGLHGRGVKLHASSINRLGPAAILLWEGQHFVVLEAVTSRSVTIVDPASGQRVLTCKAFEEGFSGIALVFENPGSLSAESADTRTRSRLFATLHKSAPLFKRILAASLLIQLLLLALPVATKLVVDQVAPHHDQAMLLALAAGGIYLAAFRLIAGLLRGYLLVRVRTILDVHLTAGFVDHLLDLPLRFFHERSGGDLLLRLSSNANVRDTLTSGTMSALLDGGLSILYLTVLLATSSSFAFIAILLAGLNILVYATIRRPERELMSRVIQAQSVQRGYEVEMFGGIETLKSLGREDEVRARWSALFADTVNASIRRGHLEARASAVLDTLQFVSPLAILLWGTHLVANEALELGSMLALSSVATAFLLPLSNLVETLMQIQLMRSYVERIEDVLDEPAEQRQDSVRKDIRLTGRVALRDVSFAFTSTAEPTVRRVNLEVQRGEFVAIVGKSGAGKSTLARLLVGLHRPTSGTVEFDGHDLWKLDLRSVRRQLGVVTQKPHIFGTTIFENIAMSDQGADGSIIEQAARIACIHDDVQRLPMGYQTSVADGGSSLSGGQCQRIALARALVCEPAILLLDEATSELDTVTERRVQNNIAELSCTRIVVAHRISTVIAADRIIVVDDGKIVESGRHDQLIAMDGAYRRLIDAQLSTESNLRGSSKV